MIDALCALCNAYVLSTEIANSTGFFTTPSEARAILAMTFEENEGRR